MRLLLRCSFALLPLVVHGWSSPSSLGKAVPTSLLPLDLLASPAELKAVRSSASGSIVVHFHAAKCRRCRATRAIFDRIAREWPDETTRFYSVLVRDDATNAMAVAEGIKNLPAIRVYAGTSGAEEGAAEGAAMPACVVSCTPRGTGRSRKFSELRDAIRDVERNLGSF